MKNIKKFVLSLFITGLVLAGGFSLVTKVEAGIAPKITSGVLAANNNYIDVNFDVGIYGAANGVTPVNAASFSIIFTQHAGTATAAAISTVTKTNSSPLTGGETTVRVNLSITGTPSGVETVEIIPSGPASIYNVTGDAMSPLTETTGALTLNGLATIISAKITSSTQFTIVYSHALNAAFTNYSGLFIDGHAAASINSMTGTGTATHVITFTSNLSFPATVASTGTVSIAALSGTVGTGFPGQVDRVLTDGQSPAITSVVWTNVDANTGISGTDTIDVTFNEPINPLTIDPSNVTSQLLNVLTGHSFGTVGAGQNVSWNLAGTVLRITLGSNTTVVNGDIVDPVAGVTDAAGNPDASTPLPVLDTAAPIGSVAASASVIKIGSTTQTINVTYSEPMAITHPTISFNHGTFVTNSDGAWSDTTHYHESFVDSSAESFSAVTTTTSGATDLALNPEGVSLAGTNNPFILDTIVPSIPTVDISTGTYTGTQNVSLSSVGSTSIRYTTDGTIPSCTVGTIFTSAITIYATQTISAKGCDNAGNPSTLGSFLYTISGISGGGGGSYSPTPVISTPTVTPVIVPVKIPEGCTSSTLFSPSTGKPCKKIGLAPGPTTILQSILDTLSLIVINPKELIGSAPGPTTIVPSVLDAISVTPITQTKTTGSAPGPTIVTGLTPSTLSAASDLLSKVQAINTNIFLGMRGNEQIRSIQQFLIAQNKGPAAKAISAHGLTPNFGDLTKAALIEWQKAVGIAPATGVFGPATRAKMQELGM